MTVALRVPATPTTPALLLRPWVDGDVEGLVEAYRDPVLRRWTRMPVSDAEEAMHWLALQAEGWRSGRRHSFAILEDEPLPGRSPEDRSPEDRALEDGSVEDRRVGGAGGLLGNVVLKTAEPGSGSAEVGYWTAAHARGRGIAPLALEALTGWAFDTFASSGLDRLDLLHQVDNPASCRVAEKAAYRFEQVLPARPPFPNDGHLHTRHRTRVDAGAAERVTSPAR